MDTWEWLLLVLAVIVLVFARKVCAVRSFRKGEERVTAVHPVWGAFAAGVIVWIIFRNFYPWLADRARGDNDWWENDLFRWVIILGFVLSIGCLVWAWIRDKDCEP